MEVKKQKTLSLKDSFIRQMEKDILSGRLSVGQKLPPERELAERFAVSKAVIHAGILEMEENGFLLVRPRVGTFVSDFRMDGGKETLLSLMNHDGGSLCAELLYLSPNTVKVHASNLYRKLGVSNRVQAVQILSGKRPPIDEKGDRTEMRRGA